MFHLTLMSQQNHLNLMYLMYHLFLMCVILLMNQQNLKNR